MQNLKLLVEGRVQGVGYRQFILTNARRLGINGTVRNLSDGKVEIIAIGSGESIAELIKIARKGPAFSWVYNVQVFTTEESMIETFNNFSIEYDRDSL